MTDIFLDVETQRLAHEVPGGWNNIPAFGLAVAVTWDEASGFRSWRTRDVLNLVAELQGHDRIIGYNILRFDYAVLSAYYPGIVALLAPKTVDILLDIAGRLGAKPPLESVAQATLGRSKTGGGGQAVQWYRQGEIEKVIAYCQDDVSLTRDIYYFGKTQGYILYLQNSQPIKVMVQW
jgi:DEAD/DEAH box helicase domain-containing protein